MEKYVSLELPPAVMSEKMVEISLFIPRPLLFGVLHDSFVDL